MLGFQNRSRPFRLLYAKRKPAMRLQFVEYWLNVADHLDDHCPVSREQLRQHQPRVRLVLVLQRTLRLGHALIPEGLDRRYVRRDALCLLQQLLSRLEKLLVEMAQAAGLQIKLRVLNHFREQILR